MITRIQIRNFKSINNAHVQLSRLNILIGANGVGKSNFIGCFKLLNKIYNQELRNYVATQGGANNILYYGRKKSPMMAIKTFFDNTNYYDFALSPDNKNGFYFAWENNGFNKKYQNPNEKQDWHTIDAGIGHNESNLINEENTERYRYVKEYFDSFKIYHFEDTSNEAKVKQSCQITDNRFLREDGGNLAAFLFRLQKQHPSNFKFIEATIKSIAPFFKGFDLKPLADNKKYIMLEWKDKDDTDTLFDASSLSDGTLRMMCLTTLLLQPDPPKTIIIDEPELGLHPFAINKLAGLLTVASTKSQIIVSTQSVNLINNFTPEDIIVVDRIDKQSAFKRLTSAEISGWLEDYSLGEIWDKNIIGGRPL